MMSDEKGNTHRQASCKEEEVACFETKERLAYAVRPWSEQDDEEVTVWREYQIWEER